MTAKYQLNKGKKSRLPSLDIPTAMHFFSLQINTELNRKISVYDQNSMPSALP